MEAEGMPLPGNVDKYEADAALDTIIRARSIESNPKMMRAVTEAARRKAQEAEIIADSIGGSAPKERHQDRDRPGRVRF